MLKKHSFGRRKVQNTGMLFNSLKKLKLLFFYQITLATILVTLMGALTAAAAPSISSVSGTFSNSQAAKLYGSGFGSKSPAVPKKYDDFEPGTNNAALSGWALSYQNDPPRYSDSFRRMNSKMSVKSHTNEPAGDPGYQYRDAFGIGDPDGLDEVYIDFWWYYDGPERTPACLKFIRLYPNATEPYSGEPNLYIDFDSGRYTGHLDQDGITTSVDGHKQKWINENWDWSQAASWAGGTWVHIQAYFKASDIGVENGTAQAWQNCDQFLNEEGNLVTRTNSNPKIWKSIWLGNYLRTQCSPYGPCSGGPSCIDAEVTVAAYYDNVYIDNTRSRVEIGDNSKYDGCKHREIQAPTAWSENSIDIKVNQGSFQQGDVVYIFVVDSNGNVSEGYRADIDGEFSSSDPPGSPKNLHETN